MANANDKKNEPGCDNTDHTIDARAPYQLLDVFRAAMQRSSIVAYNYGDSFCIYQRETVAGRCNPPFIPTYTCAPFEAFEETLFRLLYSPGLPNLPIPFLNRPDRFESPSVCVRVSVVC